jgi:two-component system OmpR family sensor kinase
MRSIRARVLAATLGLVSIALIASAATTYGALQSFLQSRMDDQLDSLQQPVQLAVFGQNSIGPNLTGQDLSAAIANATAQLYGVVPTGGFVKVLYPNGKTLMTFAPHPKSEKDPAPILPPLTADNPISQLTVPSPIKGDPGYRVHVAIQHMIGPPLWLVIGLSLRDLNSTLQQLLLIEALVGGATLALIAAVGLWIVRIGLRPLDRMAATSQRIATGDLSLRVQPSDPATEIGRLGAALNSMLAKIEGAFRERQASEDRLRRFTADAAHELRTPLTSVRGYAELFRRGADRRPEDLAVVMRRIEDEASRMSRLVDELLLLARLDQRRALRRENVDLSAIAAEAVDACYAADPARRIDLDAPDSVIVTGDPERLRQVFDNLLSNVRMHTPPKTGATVRVRMTDPPGNGGPAAVAEVIDRGRGINAQAGEHVFERFYRADPGRSRERGGYGLGLSIVDAIVDAHGGRCELESKPGKGATFRLILPLSAALPKAPIPGAAAGRR